MSPRRNRPTRPSPAPRSAADADEGRSDGGRSLRGADEVQRWGEDEWMVRAIPGGASSKTYRCPGCQQEIRPGLAHVVAWPLGWWSDESDRRHWHTGCWAARERRTP